LVGTIFIASVLSFITVLYAGTVVHGPFTNIQHLDYLGLGLATFIPRVLWQLQLENKLLVSSVFIKDDVR